MRFMLIAAVCIGFAGCAAQYMWVRDGATPDESERDRNGCIYEATLNTPSYNLGRTPRTNREAAAQGITEGVMMGLRQSELTVLCMHARGYTQVAITSAPPAVLPSPQPMQIYNTPIESAPPSAPAFTPPPTTLAQQAPAPNAKPWPPLQYDGLPVIRIEMKGGQ